MTLRSIGKNMLAGSMLMLASYSSGAWAAEGAGAEQWRMASDLIVARPLGAVITAAGAVAFVVGLPFSAAAGTIRDSAQTLVVGPAKETFVRCLGCVNSGRLRVGESSR